VIDVPYLSSTLLDFTVRVYLYTISVSNRRRYEGKTIF